MPRRIPACAAATAVPRYRVNFATMILRYLFAAIGALAVTIGLLLFMSDITQRYVTEDPIRYFRIMDVIYNPDRGRQRVRPPSDPRLAPEVPDLEHDPLREAPLPVPDDPSLTIDPELLRPPVAPESA
jgi:hypothetical protein